MKHLLIIATGIIILSACEIFEKDLKDIHMELYTPADSTVTIELTNLFWWKEVEQSKGYRLQIVSPDFNSINKLLLDTLVTANKFSYSLNPGIYQWRLRAENNSSESAYEVRSLQIDSTNDLTTISLQLYSPADQSYTNDSTPTFAWQNLYNATSYTFQVLEGSNLKYTTTVTNDSLTVPFISFASQEGWYTWQVRANNQFSSSANSKRTLYFDFTKPNAAILLNPPHGSVHGDSSITFTWKHGSDNGSPLTDSFQVSVDSSNWNTLKAGFLVSDSTATDSLGTGTYYWRVRTLDKAGNKAPYSTIRKLTIL